MSFSIRRDLSIQLLALYLFLVIPVVVAWLAFDRMASQRLETDVKSADLALARAIAKETATVIASSLQTVHQLANYQEVISADTVKMDGLFSSLFGLRPDVNLIYRLDSKGTMVYHYPTGPGSTVGWDFSFRDYFQRSLNTHIPLVSEGRISPTTKQPVATAVMPLWKDDHFLGLVATNIKLQSLSSTLESIAAAYPQEEGFDVVIIDAAGHVIAHPNPTFLLNDLSEELPQVTGAVLSGESGSLIDRVQTGQEFLYSYVQIPSAGWGVIVSRPTATAFATIRATHQGVLLTVAVFLVIGIFFWIALSRLILQPLERLAVFSQTIGVEEDFPDHLRQPLIQLSKRPDQIGHLIRSLWRMEQTIEARLKELSTLLQTSAAVVSTLDPQTVLNRILEQVERLMDIQKCAIVALDEQRGVFRAQASRGLSQRYAEQLNIEPNEPLSVSLRAIRSGESIQISDVELDPTSVSMRPRARDEGYRSVLAVPLNTQHAPPSALLVYRPDPHVFSEREINLLTNFANHAAMAIENAALYARSDMQLKEQTRRLEALIQSLQHGLILEDLEGRVLYANRRISELVDLPLDEINGAPVELIIERILSQAVDAGPDQKGETRAAVEAALNTREARRQVEIAIETQQHTRYLRLQVFDVTDSNGMPIGRGQILRDITRDREIDRMKSSLISTVSHELRTPLAAIKGYATTLLADDVQWDTASQREFLEIISDETDHLSMLVNDLLNMSRIEAGNLDLSRQECSLEELVHHAAQRSYPRPDERLQIDLPSDLPLLYADPQQIEAVLRNLIENAVKYAGDTSPVRVSASIQNDDLIVRVEDEGPGIPVEHSQRIFDSFYRVEDGLTRSLPGAGLGLSICQGFINAHGGKIWLEQIPKGTCIAFSLPLNTTRDTVPLDVSVVSSVDT